jgi:hypothetical protein
MRRSVPILTAFLLTLSGNFSIALLRGAEVGPSLRPRPFTIADSDRAHWAFQPVRSAVAPKGTHPIDHLLQVRLRQAGLNPNPPATPREQVRRAYLDLWGLPPSPEVVAEFERHPTDAAWVALVDRLLGSPNYGERWGRHWLDLVRYAESNGYERDGPKPHAWRYRDYVIDSFNSDKPYDEFMREQLAGDELAEAAIRNEPTLSPQWRASLIATGFYRLHIWDDEPDNTAAAEFDDLDDMLSTTGTAFLGMSVGCARCHDHKFDPISQTDYYSLLGFLRNIDGYGQQHTGGGGRGTGKIIRPLATASEASRWQSQREARLKELRQRASQASGTEAKRSAEAALKQAEAETPPFDFALAVAENGPKPRPTRILLRGDVQTPGAEVSPAFPAIFAQSPPPAPERPTDAASTGRRRQLAEWMSNPQNPLTARVMANRVWQHHFGTGLVPTPDDFGFTGLPPSHPELLDHLASELVRQSWHLKALHRQVMTSRAYRMSSQARSARARNVDDSNRWVWRQNLRRLEAEAIRDSVLTISGRLNPDRGGPSVFPTLPAEVHTTQDSAGKGWQDSPQREQDRRSIYLVVKRALKVPLLECFDAANGTVPTGQRSRTTVAPQALTLLNDPWIQIQAAAFADRVTREAGTDRDRQIQRAFALALQRPPTAAEARAARNLLRDQAAAVRLDPKNDHPSGLRTVPQPGAPQAALVSLCRGLLNVNEVLCSE